jgi:hypothetical protein
LKAKKKASKEKSTRNLSFPRKSKRRNSTIDSDVEEENVELGE